MTTREFEGLRVIADQGAESVALSRSPKRTGSGGKPIQYHQIRELLLEDGSTAYGCLHCDYASRKLLSIRPHLNKHRTVPRAQRRPAEPVPTSPATGKPVTGTVPKPSVVGTAATALEQDFPDVAALLRTARGQRDWQAERASLIEWHEQHAAKLIEQRDGWKKRANDAERMLKAFNDALSAGRR